MKLKKRAKSYLESGLVLTMLATALLTTACGGGGGGGGGGTGGGGGGSSYGSYSSPYVTAQGFITALNDVDWASFPNDNFLLKDIDETVRSAWDAEDWFVYYDAEHSEYVAASLQYLRTIAYYDYYSSNYNLADEFRDIQDDDAFFGGLIGDGAGNDYEIVDYDYTLFGEDYYLGFDSGYLYEDEDQTTDVSLMVAEEEDRAFYQKAASVSLTYGVDIKTSLSLVTLGTKVEKMLDRTNSELTLEDQAALLSDLESVTGASLTEFAAAAEDQQKKDELVAKVAAKIGTSAENLENRLLPELFNIEL
jgi:hypothetical protein